MKKVVILLVLWCVTAGTGLFAAEKSFRDEFTPGPEAGLTSGGGRLSGKAVLDAEAGKPFARLAGAGTIAYPAIETFPAQGVIHFRLRLDMDMSDSAKTPENRKFQYLFALERKRDQVQALGYITPSGGSGWNFRFYIFGPGEKMFSELGVQFKYKQGQWYDIRIVYDAQETTLFIDNRQMAAVKRSGLFGPLAPSPLGMTIGSPLQENCFSIADFSIASADRVRQSASIPLVNSVPPPVLDGKLDDAFWRECPGFTGFTTYRTGMLAPEQPLFRVGYTDRGLYLAARVPMPKNVAPNAVIAKHDGAIYDEDAIEFRLMPGDDRIYSFIGSVAGTRFDCLNHAGTIGDDMTYNPDWQLATQNNGSDWTAEAFVPWSALDLSAMPKTGTQWKGNLFVDRAGAIAQAMSQTPSLSGFGDPDGFARWVFTGSGHALGVESLAGCKEAAPALAIRKTGGIAPVVTLKGELRDAGGAVIAPYEFKLNDAVDTIYAPGPLNPGNYSFRLTGADADGLELFNQEFYFASDLKAAAALENYPSAGYADADITVPAALYANCCTGVRASLLAPDGRVLAGESRKLADNRANFRFDNRNLAPGKYTVVFEFLDRTGKVLDKNERILVIYPKPDWLGNQLGVDHTVPAPWTPIVADNSTLKVWGRSYVYNHRIFPDNIVNQSQALFTAAPRFEFQSSSQTVDLAAVAAVHVDARPDAVSYAGETRCGAMRIKLKSTLEFDGCLRGDLEFLPPPSGATIESFTMRFPIAPEWAKFLVAGTGSNQSVLPLPNQFRQRFTPYVWVGSDRGGVAVFFESSEFWTADNAAAVEIARNASGGAELIFRIVARPEKRNQPYTLTFGLMASPVRPPSAEGPFAYTCWVAKTTGFSRPERIKYKKPALNPVQGSFDMLFRLLPDRDKKQFELFGFRADRGILYRAILNDEGTLYLFANSNVVAQGKVGNLSPEGWNAFGCSWKNDRVTLAVNGVAVCMADVPGWSTELRNVSANGGMFAGAGHEYNASTAFVADEVRISGVDRPSSEFTVPDAPRSPDAATIALDHLDDRFLPDGFSTLTAGGGEPSIGSRFVSGRFGGGLELVTEAPRNGDEVVARDMKTDVTRLWNWHRPEHADETQWLWPPDYFNPPNPVLAAKLKEAHDYGMKLIPYTFYPAIHSPGPLADQFGAEWCVKPVNLMPYPPPAGHNMLSTSFAAPGFVDYLVGGIDDLFRKHPLDGIYTDGCLQVRDSTNAAYGCGYTDAGGNRIPTTPFFAVREAWKRIYKVVKADPKRIIVNHQSFALPVMTVGFSDMLYTAEHEDYTDLLTARLRFSPGPWGTYITLLGSSEHAWSSLHTMTGLLVGTSLWGSGVVERDDWARKAAKLREAYEKFGYAECEFFPFFTAENELVSEALPANIHIAGYLKKGQKLLLLVANYNPQPVAAAIELKVEKLGFSPREAHSALTGAAMPLAGATVTVSLLPENFQLVEVWP